MSTKPRLVTVASASVTSKPVSTGTAKSGITKLNAPAEHDPIKCFRDSVGIGADSEGTEYLNFAVNQGPGSSSQTIEIAHISDLISAMRIICDDGLPEKQTNISPAEMMLSTIHLTDEGKYRFRLAPNTKSVTLSAADFSRLFNELSSIEGKIAAAKSKVRK